MVNAQRKQQIGSSESAPVAVLVADVHYNLNTMQVADTAMRTAIQEANRLGVPFVVAGDLHDTKAMLRGECIKMMIDTFKTCQTEVFVIVGNHCKINEKGEAHSLEFLRPYCTVVDVPMHVDELKSWLIPYYSSSEEMQAQLDKLPKGSRIITHTGVQTAYMGHYQQDKSSLPKEAFKDFRVISGHYHRAQDIKCGRPRKGAVGLFSYVGNPYTLSFGEAEDGPKGFRILHDDGLLTQVLLDLRKHVVIDLNVDDEWCYYTSLSAADLVWIKLRGPSLELAKINKKEIGQKLIGHTNFKLDKIPTDEAKLEASTEKLTGEQIFDMLIDGTDEQPAEKQALKSLWREVLE